MNKEIYNILCCPDTKQSVTELDAETVKEINAKIAAKSIKTVAGKIIGEKIDSALVREDGTVAYAVRNNIPIMLTQEGFDPR